ncbi:MAG: hypothetical protein ACKOCX_13370 [Planctomycetota bacterium]
MRLARAWVATLAPVHEAACPAAAVAAPHVVFAERSPAVILLAADQPGRWSLDDVLALAVRWPLAPIVSVAGVLVDGRRRSGPPLPGIEEVPWHDLPGRLACWLADRAAGRPGTLGLPATVRREDRFVEASLGVRAHPGLAAVSVAAAKETDLESLVDLLRAAGGTLGRRSRGRPPLDEPAPVLLWDVGRIDGEHLAWLGMLAANRPGLKIVLFESFPRPETTLAALQAGAAAVLGRPASAEAVAGTLAVFAAGNDLCPVARSS